jgi:hypothetical protein
MAASASSARRCGRGVSIAWDEARFGIPEKIARKALHFPLSFAPPFRSSDHAAECPDDAK